MMIRIILVLILLISFPQDAWAACTGSGLTWSCAAGSTSARFRTSGKYLGVDMKGVDKFMGVDVDDYKQLRP